MAKTESWWERIDKDEEQNLMGATMEAFEEGATMGEIGGAMRLAYNCPYDPHGLI